MSNDPNDGSWSARSGSNHPRSQYGGDRRLTESESPNVFIPPSALSRHTSHRAEHRPQSAAANTPSSSLTGAMGEAHSGSQNQRMGSPIPGGDQPCQMGAVLWSSTQYGSVSGQGSNMPYQTLSSPPASSSAYPNYPGYSPSVYPNTPPEILPSTAATYGSYEDPSGFAAPRPQLHRSVTALHHSTFSEASVRMTTPPSGHTRPHSSAPTMQGRLESDARQLHDRIHELEQLCEASRRRIRQLEAELAQDTGRSSRSPGPSPAEAVSSISSPTQPSSSFRASWKARTDARVRQFCSLNRAGNALCAWHDSRRERRVYPPRMAPPGYLNCGCTYDEALFEESLARHGVGSYHPGESVRMDPGLRNPLLKLLQDRYRYRDGDFERDPVTGGWIEGEGHQYWEQKLSASGLVPRKLKTDERH